MARAAVAPAHGSIVTARERIEAAVSALTGKQWKAKEAQGGNGYWRLVCGPYASVPYRNSVEGGKAAEVLASEVEQALAERGAAT